MVKKESDIIREQQLPGRNFSSGITLFEIAESHGKKLGQPQSIPSDAIVEDKNKEILAKAIPADKIENVLRANSKVKPPSTPLVKRGTVMIHIPTRKRVTILRANVDTSASGDIRHQVCLVGTSHKFLVPEKNLVEVKNG